jgi:hypothetical protein
MAGYGPPLIDFSPLGQLGQVYQTAYDAAEKRRFQNEVPGLLDSIPKLMAQAEGVDTTPLKTAVQSDQQAASGPKLPSFAAAQGGAPDAKISGLISTVSEKYGLNPDYLPKLVMTESGGDPNAANPSSSARGLTQFTSGTAKQYGLSNPLDPAANLDAAARLTLDNKAALTQALGREPTPGELYLAHQQGAGGAAKLLTNPTARAADLVGGDAIRLNGGDPNMTAGQFAAKWTGKFDGQTAKADVPAEGSQNAQFQVPGQQPSPQATQSALERMKPEQRAVLRQLLANPNTQKIGLELLTKSLTPDEYGFQTVDNQLVRTNKRTGTFEPVNVGRSVRSLNPSEFAQYGVPADYKGAVQIDQKGALTFPGKPATEVNIDQKAEGKFAEVAATGIGKRFEKLSEEGDTARTDLALIGQLRSLGDQMGGTGAVAAARGWLADRGVKLGENVGAVEAYGSIIDKLTPQQRVPGTGATSDYEGRMFKSSLPKLLNTPEGNALVADTLEALAQAKVARAQIAEQALTKEITPNEAIKQLRALPDPMTAFKEARKQNPDLTKPGAPADAPQATPKASQPQASPVLDEARAAIARGAPRDAVIRRLRENGIDASGL